MAWSVRIVVFVLALAGFAAAFAPASFFLRSREGGFEYESAQGSIWNAHFSGARLAGLDAGEMGWRLLLFDLVQGRMKAVVDFSGGALQGEAVLLANSEGDRRIAAERLRISGAPFVHGAGLSGETQLRDLDLYFDDGRCAWARGEIVSDVLAENEDALAWRGPALIGAARCEGDLAILSMEGGGADGAFRSDLVLGADGAGVWRAQALAARPNVTAMLGAGGFIISAQDGIARTERNFQWLPD